MFLPNVPGAMFIPGATSIPESRVGKPPAVRLIWTVASRAKSQFTRSKDKM